MSEPKTIFVVVCEPKTADEVPRSYLVHANDNPHGGQQFLQVGDDPFEVRNSTDIRRRMRPESCDLRLATDADFAAAKKRADEREAKVKAEAEAAAKAKAEEEAKTTAPKRRVVEAEPMPPKTK